MRNGVRGERSSVYGPVSDGLIFRRQGATLLPVLADGREWLERRRDGSAVILEPVQVRNVERNALYWCLCQLVVENQDQLKDKVAVDLALKLRAGHSELVQYRLPDGEWVLVQIPGSIAFANMKEYEFEAYLTRALEVIATELLPGVDVDALRKEAYVASGNEFARKRR